MMPRAEEYYRSPEDNLTETDRDALTLQDEREGKVEITTEQTGYCIKCKAPKIMEDPVSVKMAGPENRQPHKRYAIGGKCPDCHTSMYKLDKAGKIRIYEGELPSE